MLHTCTVVIKCLT